MVHETRTAFDLPSCSPTDDTSESPSAFHDELNEDCAPPVEKADKQPMPAGEAGQEKPKAENAPAPRPEDKPAKLADMQPKPGTEERSAPRPVDVQQQPRPEGGGVEPRRAPDVQVIPGPVDGGVEVGRIEPVKKAAPHPLLPPSHDPVILDAPLDELKKISTMPANNEMIFKWAKGAHIEMIRRNEEALPASEVQQAKKAIPLLLQALKEGKMIELGPDNKPFVGKQELSPDDRLRLHQAVLGDLSMIAQKATGKAEAAMFLYANRQYKDAEAYALWAKEGADDIPIDLLREEAKQLKADIALYDDPQKRDEMLQLASQMATDGKSQAADMMPLQTRKLLTMLYMGTEFKQENGQMVSEFGKTTGFKPALAFEMAKETREKTKELLGFDPLDEKQARQDPEVASLFGGIFEMIGNPEKYNLYKLVDEHQLDKMQKELKKYSGTDSMLADIGVVAVTAGVLALSRNSRVQAGLENMLRRVGPGAEKSAATISKVTGLGAAALGAPLVRHYGYKALSGLEENWSDTGVHAVGSLAAAELGGRVLGHGSMLTGRMGRGVTTLQHFDKVGSAEWLSMQGYNTTGKIADLLKSSGYSAEATIFANVPRGTKLTSEVGMKAIEQANLTNSRLATVARSVTQDLRAASGFDSSKVAESLGKSSGGKIATVDDIARVIDQDKQVLEQYLKNANTSRKSALVQDSLGQHGFTADGHRLAEAVEKLGVKNVGEAEKLLVQLEKGLADQFPKIAEMQASGLANGATKLTDLAATTNRLLDGPGLDRLLSHVPVHNRAGLLTDKIIDEVMTGVSKNRTKIQEAVLAQSNVHALPGVPSHFGVATPSSISRTNWSTSLMAGGTIAGTYNSIVKTWDKMQLDNPATGQPYSLGEAFSEAHFPTILDPKDPAVLRYATSFLLGTPGQTFAAALMLRPGAIHQGQNSGFSQNMPWTKRGWNNLNANVFSTPGMSGAGALGATLWKPIIDDSARNGHNSARYKELLNNSQAPIANKPLPR